MLTKEEIAAYLKDLQKLVIGEAIAEREHVHRIWSKPLSSRVAEGRAIEGLEVVGSRENGDLILRCERNESRFREGDILCLNTGDPFSEPKIIVNFEEEDADEITVSPYDMGMPWSELSWADARWVLDEGYLNLSSYFLDAINEVGDTAIGRDRILPLLMGGTRPRIDTAHLERGLSHGDSCGLNWSQAEALAHAYATDSIYLIQGPPGTGKTWVLAYLAQLLADEGERVLVTSFTHRAINNALNMLCRIDDLTAVAKIGHLRRSEGLLTEAYGTFDASPMAGMDRGYVIGATPFATRTGRLSGVEFDTVIFDEGSQVTLPLAVMGMLRGTRYIFIGDDRQLPPVLVSKRPSQAFRYSIFRQFAGRGFDTMLRETYRLNDQLLEWPSREFYMGELRAVDGVHDRKIGYTQPPRRHQEILDPNRSKVFIDAGHRNTSTRSSHEANIVVGLIEELLRSGVPSQEIGVVTPYRAQAREIRRLMRSLARRFDGIREIVVDTVERMQGQERDVILVSLTTSNPAFAVGIADFFFQPERLNVAITRARVKLIIVGSSHLFSIESDDPDLKEQVELLRDLVKSCDQHAYEFEAGP